MDFNGVDLIPWEEEMMLRKYVKKNPKVYDLMTQCIKCFKHIGYFGYILDIYIGCGVHTGDMPPIKRTN